MEVAVARPYAAAVFAHARADDSVAAWGTMLATMAQVAAALVEHTRGSYLVSAQETTDIILEALGDDIGQAPKNFLAALADNDRLTALPAIAERFDELRREDAGIVQVRVESAQAFADKKAKESFNEFLAAWQGKTVQVDYEENPALIGGVRVYVRDNVLDASIRGRLDKLAENFSG